MEEDEQKARLLEESISRWVGALETCVESGCGNPKQWAVRTLPEGGDGAWLPCSVCAGSRETSTCGNGGAQASMPDLRAVMGITGLSGHRAALLDSPDTPAEQVHEVRGARADP